MKGIRLTDRQSEALDVIRNHIKDKSVPPSRAEIARALGIKYQGSVDYILNALAKKGWLRLIPSVERGIQLLREGAPLVDLYDLPDHLPEIAAGNPISHGDYPEPKRLHDFDTLSEQFGTKPDYFLKVRGDSMDKLGLKSGDIVAMKQTEEARDGSIVVVRIGKEITIKRFRRTADNGIILEPLSTNPTHESNPIHPQTDFQIAGVVVGTIATIREQAAAERIQA